MKIFFLKVVFFKWKALERILIKEMLFSNFRGEQVRYGFF